MMENWRLDFPDDGLAWLTLDKRDSSANVLSRAVMTELADALAAVAARPGLRGLVISSAKAGSFIAGADIHEFPLIGSEEEAYELTRGGQRIFAALEALPCPSVAVLNGSTLGGGLELALAATWRIGLPAEEPCIGFPEVQLGLHPGFGGTVRAVRLAGARRGLQLMLTGRSLTMRQAVAQGLIDRMATPEDWRREAAALLARPRPRRRAPLPDRLLSLAPLRGFVARAMERQAQQKADPRHYPAPYAMIRLWREHGAAGEQAYEAEARSFARLAVTPTSRNLVRVFFLSDRMKHLAPRPASPARRVHVIGAGIMGGDIAAWCALRGLSVTLQDRELKYVEPALERARKLFERRFQSAAAREQALARLRADVAGDGAAQADVVIEAIFEDLAAKQALFRTLEGKLRPECVLATNTSSIELDSLMGALREPARLIGLHFFNPVAKLPLVEVVHAQTTAAAAFEGGLAFARQIGKLPLPCRSNPGFLVNRILAPYLAEAMTLAEEGVPLPDIDQAATDFGMPMGPIELADSVGLDVALHVARILSPLVGRPLAPELERLVQQGHLGRKTGRGFYLYQDGRPVRPRSSARTVSPDVQDRLVYALLNEAAKCFDEQIVADAELVDAGVIFGTGFAPFRGGPLHHARTVGIGKVTERLQELCTLHGARFRPSAGWEKLYNEPPSREPRLVH